MKSKAQMIKDILSIRRRVNLDKGAGVREIEIFEAQVEKSIRRIEQDRYLAKKFNEDEIAAILKAYEALVSSK